MDITSMNKGNYLCSVCGSSFSTFFNLKKHVEAKHPQNVDELVMQKKAIRSNSVFSCNICSRRFRHKKFLRRHLQLHQQKRGLSKASTLISVASDISDDSVTQQVDDHTYMDAVVKFEKDEVTEDSDFVCGNCGGIFSTLFNLRKHVRAKHPDLLDTLAPRKKIGKFRCEECGKKFSHTKSLARHRIGKHKPSPDLKECEECGKPFLNLVNFHKHMKNKHPDSMATLVLQGIKDGEFSCGECGKVFSQRKNLRRHVMDKHVDASAYYTGKPVAIYQCPLCSFNRSGDVSLIMNHFKVEHSINVAMKTIELDSKESFLKWKEELEIKTKASYIRKAHVGSTSYFRCHRSGKYKPRGRGIRNLKTQGTNKIGGFCPAGMQVRIEGDKYYVRYSEIHVGHTNDLKYLKISARERQSLASEISAQIPLDEILMNVKKSTGTPEKDVARLSLVTKQDLNNIMRQYQLEGTAVRRSTAADSLDSWLLNAKHNVLYYKPQHCPDEDALLYPNDFVLIIMTDIQKDILNRFGGGCVCLDRTDSSMNRLFLSTIMVIDGLESGFPVAFLISNRMDGDMLEFFFTNVKQAVGDINPGLLLTDVSEDYYTAWSKVMGQPGQTLFSLWQVERDWRENLYSLMNDELTSDLFLQFWSLMNESDQRTFHHCLNVVSSDFNKSNLFTQYFLNNYSENFRYWSRVYRPVDALSVDRNLERLHYSIRYLYTEVKRNQRLDRTIDSILQFIENRLFERAANLERSSHKKIKNIVAGHRLSLVLNIKNILKVNNSWHVFHLNKNQTDYRIDEVEPDCNCDLKCHECDVCIHRFVCTCPDSILKSNMCKHIHLVCQFIGTNSSIIGLDKAEECEEFEAIPSGYVGEIVIVETDDFNTDVYSDYNVKTEITEPTIEIEENIDEEHILNEKKDVITSLSNEIIQSINSVDEGEAFIQILKAAKPTVGSLSSDSKNVVYISDDSGFHQTVPVKRILFTAPSLDSNNVESNNCSGSGNAIEAHITLDSDGITLLSQAANFASASD